jgi:hypothetical protein
VLAAPTQDTIMSVGGSVQISPNPLLINDFGWSWTTGGNSAFAHGAMLAMTVVGDQPYRMLGASIPLGLSLTIRSSNGATVHADGLRIVSAEPGIGYDYSVLDGKSGEVLFEMNGGAFAYDPGTQILGISQAWLRVTESLATHLNTPRAAGNLIADASLVADMVVVRSDPFGGAVVDGLPADSGQGGPRAGGDVTYHNITDVGHYGPVGATHAYIFGTATCNMGNQNIAWTNAGTPGVAFNMFRLQAGRLMQIGQGFVKTACCAAAGNGCGIACNGQGGSVLGAGCLDVYGSGWNAQQNRLMPRSQINSWTGSFGVIPSGSGDAIWRRCQVATADMNPANFPNALFFAEGIYVGTQDSQFNNRNNNASYRRMTLDGTYNGTLTGATATGSPGILAWRANGLGAGQIDTRVNDIVIDVPGEGRFHAVVKVTDNANGTWTYDYAVYNLSSDLAGASLEVPVAANTNVSNIGFHDVPWHSGEPYNNTDWVVDPVTTSVRWHTDQTHAQNPNANALRWGLMYNFWFTADRGPTLGTATLGLFKPGGPPSVMFNAITPGGTPGLVGDIDHDGDVDLDDLSLLLSDYGCTVSGQQLSCIGDLNGDTRTDIDDLTLLLAHYGEVNP